MRWNFYSVDKMVDRAIMTRLVNHFLRLGILHNTWEIEILDFNLCPFSLFESDGSKEITGYLISQNP